MADIEESARQLQVARKHYEDARADCEELRRKETIALNALNDAQKAFDEAVAEIKETPPWNSHWHRSAKTAAEE